MPSATRCRLSRMARSSGEHTRPRVWCSASRRTQFRPDAGICTRGRVRSRNSALGHRVKTSHLRSPTRESSVSSARSCSITEASFSPAGVKWILNTQRKFRVFGARNQAVVEHSAQALGQDLGRDARDKSLELSGPINATSECGDNCRRPLAADNILEPAVGSPLTHGQVLALHNGNLLLPG